MKRSISLFMGLTLLLSCSKENDFQKIQNGQTANKVLMLKVDYTTNTFEGGRELTFTEPTATFTISNQYQAPGDFGSIKLIYQELNETLFDGTIHWMGSGEMNFPANLESSEHFNIVTTKNIVYPGNGFQNVFNPNNETYDYTQVWLAIQGLVKVREYLSSNLTETVKIFLYTPGVGVGNPADWVWIIYMKN